MKFLISGDWHIDFEKIKSRKDDVLAACTDKMGQIFQIAQNHGCVGILQPGDFFESHKATDFLKQYIINYLYSGMASVPIYTVFGQHDLRYHNSNVLNTPLKVLEAARVVHLLGKEPFVAGLNVDFYGASWNEDIPEIKNPDNFNVLVCHKMIVDTKIWEGQEDHTYAKTFLLRTKFDLIVSGDNHKSFIAHSGPGSSIGKRLLINCGSLLRTRIDQEDHRPCVYIYDTDPKNKPVLEQIYLHIDDFENVIRIEEARKEKEENENLKKFIEALDVDVQLTGLNYKRNVWHAILYDENMDEDVKTFTDMVFKRLEKEK